jgi:6-pyruvoyltetrahydropterin/6-carboxytetrahydropterin synthase
MSGTTDLPAPVPAGVSVELARGDLGFSAAHFSVVGGVSERLHGHNYRVSLSASGAVGDDGAVVDFRLLKAAIRAECSALDERTLIPADSTALTVSSHDEAVEVREGQRRFVFPRNDIVLLPVTNTTCECLAMYLLARVRARLGALPVRLQLRVEELPGQGATATE